MWYRKETGEGGEEKEEERRMREEEGEKRGWVLWVDEKGKGTRRRCKNGDWGWGE
jgi:hypothetical protein